VSELLDRIEKEIRERLAATRAAVLEHERLQAALQALTETGEEAARAVKGRVSRRSTGGGAPRSASQPSVQRVASPAETTAEPVPTAAPRARSAGQRKTPAARPRAPRGANREAVLKVVGERPGVTSAELAAASGVPRGTLASLLRTLVTRGELEKRSLPGGKTGYALSSTAPADEPESAPAAEVPAAPAPEPEAAPAAEVPAPPAPEPEAAPAADVPVAPAADPEAEAPPAADSPAAPADAAEAERSS
jgi:hypothetical protein